MGRIDPDKMYDIVMNWEWGNSGSDEIYHDVETRKNSITYRSNLARLAEGLMNSGQDEKAEEILDLAMEQMPVRHFEYYSLLEPYILGYYELGKIDKARQVFKDVTQKHQEFITHYNTVKVKRQYGMADEIISRIEQYRNLVEVVIYGDDETFAREESNTFNAYLKWFPHFYSAEEIIDIDKIEKDLKIKGGLLKIPLDSANQNELDLETEVPALEN
jgi:hypothetical protein